jgi:hypothetical protein
MRGGTMKHLALLLLAASIPLTALGCAANTDEPAADQSEDLSKAKTLGWGEHNHASLADGATVRYTFRGREDWEVSLVLQSLDCAPNSVTKGANGAQFGCKPAWAPRVVVIEASSRTVVKDVSGNLVSGDAIASVKLPSTGAYVVLVESASGDGGTYDLTLSPPDISCKKNSDCPSEFPKCELVGLPEEDGDAKSCN